jgi:hypothetical protein
LDILESIHKNTIDQSHALESKDDVLLGKLLKECEEHIKSFTQFMSLSDEIAGEEKDDEAVCKERAIDFLLRVILSINGDNAKKVEDLKNDIADNIKRLKVGRNFVQSSGFNMPQQFGYFFDKRI